MKLTIISPHEVEIKPLDKNYNKINIKVAKAIKRSNEHFVTGDEDPIEDFEYFNYIYELGELVNGKLKTRLLSFATFDDGTVFMEELYPTMDIKPTLLYDGTAEGVDVDTFYKIINQAEFYDIYESSQFETRDKTYLDN